jgi:flagellar motor switch protein FliN/FliY
MTTLTVQTAVAEAFAEALPAPGSLSVRTVSTRMVSGAFADPISAAFTSEAAPIRLSLQLMNKGILAAAAPAEGAVDTDLTAPAFQAAAALLGEGTLSDPAHDQPLWVANDSTSIFEISEAGRTVAYFAINLEEDAPAGGSEELASMSGKLDRIKDVELSLTVEIGRTRLTLQDAMNIEPGQVIELDRSAGAHADVLVNGRIIAHGEVVVVEGDYGVRITKIIDTRGA